MGRIENEFAIFNFYRSSLPAPKVLIHQNIPFIVQKLSKLSEIKADGYAIRPFLSLWSEKDQKCLGKYKYSFRNKNIYGQRYGGTNVLFNGGAGELTVRESDNLLIVTGKIFLKVVDSLVGIDYIVERKTNSKSLQNQQEPGRGTVPEDEH